MLILILELVLLLEVVIIFQVILVLFILLQLVEQEPYLPLNPKLMEMEVK